MKITFSLLFVALSILCCNIAVAQNPDACTLITGKQLGAMFGGKFIKKPSMVSATQCVYETEGGDMKIVKVYYSDYGIVKMPDGLNMANELLKEHADTRSEDVKKAGNDHTGPFDKYGRFPAGGTNSHYALRWGAYGRVLLLEFVSGNCLVSFETSGLDTEKVITKLPEIYKAIISHFHSQ